MKIRSVVVPAAVSFVSGVFLWLGASLASGRREPWDSSLYWAGAYPVSLAICVAIALFFPRRPWLWAIVLFEGQFVGMVLRNGELGGLWPLGMAMFAVLAVPGVVLAGLVARLRKPQSPPPPGP